MCGYNAEPPIAIPIYTVLPYCVIVGYVHTFTAANIKSQNPGSLHLLCWNPGPLHLLAAGTLVHYIYWQCWNHGPLHLLAVLEPWPTTSTDSAGTLAHYIYWQCWNPGPLHLPAVLKPSPTIYNIYTSASAGTLIHYMYLH